MLNVRDLSLSFGVKNVVAGVCLSISPGRGCVVVGPNGAGKSVLLRAILSVVAAQKSSGLSSWLSRPLSRMGGATPKFLDDHAQPTLQGEIAWSGREGCRICYMPAPMDYAWNVNVCELFSVLHSQILPGDPLEIEGFWRQPFHQLSMGQRRRVLLAALLGRPADLYLLDEPFSFLDGRYSARVLQVLKHKARESCLMVAMPSERDGGGMDQTTDSIGGGFFTIVLDPPPKE
jgi:ABC-type multidrug transport system ATPase subunit